ncbi:MAG: hypothetical protein JWO48_3603 [Bryobacterales bacterium]|nr:hypothetical protein [Bryobacterales bacterium]
MHEVRVNVQEPQIEEVARLALAAGVGRVSVYDVFVYGPNQPRKIASVETSTPHAKAFIDALFAAEWFDPTECWITTRELRALLTEQPLRELTRPMVEPALDVLEDLWQLSHVTPSYIGRAAGAAVLMAYGMFENSAISIVVAALFLPFLSQILAVSFGLWVRDPGLAKQGVFALCVSSMLSTAAGVLVALLHPGPLMFDDFKTPLVSLGISSIIGITAGLASADDTGRRYLIGVAAAVQYAVFPVWIGIFYGARVP